MFNVPQIAASRLVGEIDYHKSLGSTNDRALELAARGDPQLPLLVLTEQQFAGRGRGSNQWWAGRGALTFSLVKGAAADPVSRESWPQQSLLAGLAVCQALADLAPAGDWRVKWPNDVFVNGGKIAGILCESVPGWPGRLVIGIGVNLNNSLRAAPGELLQSARAMLDLDGITRDPTSVLLSILDKLDEYGTRLRTGQRHDICAAYRERCFLTGKTLTVTSAGRTFLGRCRGIDDAGALVLQTEQGLHSLVAGTIDSWE